MIGVIWSNRLDSVTMPAAVFCIDLNLFNRCLGRPYNKELQLSSLELINACTKFQRFLRLNTSNLSDVPQMIMAGNADFYNMVG